MKSGNFNFSSGFEAFSGGKTRLGTLRFPARFFLFLFLFSLGTQGFAFSQIYNWNNEGPTNNWNTTDANWTGAGTVWINGNTSEAVFSNTPAELIRLSTGVTANRLTFNTPGVSGYTLSTANGSILTLAGAVPEINVTSSSSASISVVVAGSNGLKKTGTGSVTLNGVNSYSGLTDIQAGNLGVAHSNGLLGTNDMNIASGAFFSLSAGTSQSVAGLTGAGTVRVSGTSSGSTFTLSGSTGGSSFLGTIADSSGGSALALYKTGLGTQTLGGSSASNYSGGTFVNGGTLIAAKNTGFGSGLVTVNGGTWGLQGDITQANTGSITGTGATGRAGGIDNISGSNTLSGALTLGGNVTLGATAGSLAINGGINLGAFSGTFSTSGSSSISVGSVIAGSGNLIKNGAGTVTLAGVNTYTGTTTVNAGTLVVNGSIMGSATNVGNGGTLGGTGIIANNVSVFNGGRLQAAQSNNLNVKNLFLDGGSRLALTLGAPNTGVASITVETNLELAGVLDITDGGGFGYGTYRLIDYGGSLTDSGLTVGSVPVGFNPGSMSIDTGTGGQVKLIVVAAVTEQYWDGPNSTPSGTAGGSGGSGTWNTSNYNWTNAAGNVNGAWAAQDAVFGGMAGTVIVGESVSADAILMVTTNYSFTSSNNSGIEFNSWRGGLTTGFGGDLQLFAAAPSAIVDGVMNLQDDVVLMIRVNQALQGGTIQLQGESMLTQDDIEGIAGGNITFSPTQGGTGGILELNGYDAVVDSLASTGGAGVVRNSEVYDVTLKVNQSTNTTFDGLITQGVGTGIIYFNKQGAGTLTITGTMDTTGTITVDGGTFEVGAGGSVDIGSAGIAVGSGGSGTFKVTSGGTVSSRDVDVGVGSTGYAVLTGAGSQWDANFYNVGRTTPGDLQVLDGAVLNASRLYVGSVSTGSAMVSGIGSELNATAGILIAFDTGGIGTLTVSEGGKVESNQIEIGNGGGTGAININGVSGSQGVVKTARIIKQGGTATVDVNGGVIHATANESNYLQNFASGDVSIGAGGLFFDTKGFDVGISPVIDGAGSLTKQGSGTLTLTGANTFTGGTTISGGTLLANNLTGSATGTGSVTVAENGTLGGSGFIGGDATIESGGVLAPGTSAGVLTFNEDLTLNAGSISAFELGTFVGSDRVDVLGQLSLGGTLNVTALTGFGEGAYTIFNYGTLSGTTLAVSSLTSPVAYDLVMDTSVANEVRLIVTLVADWLLWDTTADNGAIEGGAGTWNSSALNWTSSAAASNRAWIDGKGAIFKGAAGIVTLAAGETLIAKGLSFEADGYSIVGGNASSTLELTDDGDIDVFGDVTATISANVTGTKVTKAGAGTLVLSGNNSYIGGTTIKAGTVEAAHNSALGTGNVVVDNTALLDATLDVQTGITLSNEIVANKGGVINNNGTIQRTVSGSAGIGSLNGGAVVNNSGSISGEMSGVFFFDGGKVSNLGSTSLISSTSLTGTGVGILTKSGEVINEGIISAGDFGVILEKGGRVENSGTITGGTLGIGIDGAAATVINEGVINGGVMLGNSVNEVTLFSGGFINGDLTVGTNVTSKLILQGADTQDYSAAVTGATTFYGELIKLGLGTWTLDADLTNVTKTSIEAGKLLVNATLGGNANVSSGSTIGGDANILGTLTVANGGIVAPGNSPGVISVGELILNATSVLNFELGNSSDRIDVSGNLTLDGLLSISDAGGFGFGTYRLISYGGTLTNKGLTLQSVPFGVNPGDLFILTDTAGQVNLQYEIRIDSAGRQLWDGANALSNGQVDGGNGIWNSSRTNWTNSLGNVNGSWAAQTAVFTAFPGTVALGSNVAFEQLIFEVDGYKIAASEYALIGTSAAKVDVYAGVTATISSPIFSDGAFIKTGSGKLTLDALQTSSVNVTNLAEGSLYLNTILRSSEVLVQPNTRLGGNGLVIGNVINNGTFAPGNSPGTFLVAGNFSQSNSGTFELEIASVSVHDRLIVSGTANLAGRLNVVSLGYTPAYGDAFTFIEADAINGTFDEIDASTLSTSLRLRFAADEGSGLLVIAPNRYSDFAQTSSQRRVARALDQWIGEEEGDIGEVTLALDHLSENQYAQAFEAIAPSYYEAALSTGIELSQNHGQLLHQQLSARRLGQRSLGTPSRAQLEAPASGKSEKSVKAVEPVLAEVTDDLRWNTWVQGSGLFSNGGLSLNPGESFESGTFLVGADYALSQHFAMGVFASYQEGWGDYDNGGSIDVEAVRFGVYATVDFGGFYANAALGGGTSGYDVKRPIQFAGFDRTARGEPDGTEFFGLVGAGYDIKAGNWTFGPQFSAQYTRQELGTFNEHGAGSLNLRVSDAEAESLRTYLGGRVAYTFAVTENVSIIPEVRAFWQHEFLQGSENLRSQLDNGSSAGFDFTTSAPERDAIFIGAGIGFQVGPHFYGNVYYNADFGRGDSNHTLSLSGSWKF